MADKFLILDGRTGFTDPDGAEVLERCEALPQAMAAIDRWGVRDAVVALVRPEGGVVPLASMTHMKILPRKERELLLQSNPLF